MRRILSLFLITVISLSSIGQANFSKALDLLLKENKRTQAASMLNELTNSPTDGPSALLTLAMIEAGNEHYGLCFEYLHFLDPFQLAETDFGF